MIKSIILTFAALAYSTSLYALDITPGTLRQALGTEASTITTLTLTGSADARDLSYAASLPSLKILDMSGLNIMAVHSDTAVVHGRHQFAESTLPAYIFSLSKLEQITLPNGLRNIEACAFASAGNLHSVTFPETLSNIGDWAFYGTALTSVTLPPTDTLGIGIFAECTKLSEARLSDVRTSTLPVKTFRGCTSLRTVTFPTNMTVMGDECLLGSGLETLVIPATVKETGKYVFSSMSNLRNYSASIQHLSEGALFANPQLRSVIGSTQLGKLSLAHCPALIPDSAFTSSLTAIGDYALADNNSNRLWLSDNLVTVDKNVFDGMLNLISIHGVEMKGAIPATSIGAFDGLANIHNIRTWVLKDYLSAWQADPEWSRFELHGTTAAVDGITTDREISINAAWQGNTLTVTASEELVGVSIFSTSGSILSVSAPYTSEATLDLSDISDNIIVVRATTKSGAKTFKLRRAK